MTEPAKESSSRAKLVLVLALLVIGGGTALMLYLINEQQNSPRPATPGRYLSPADSEQTPPAPFSAPQAEENELIP
jgi:hypothetical protein